MCSSDLAVCSSPALAADGTIYQKAADGFLYALNAADGSVRWRVDIAATATTTSPVVSPDGTVYQGSNNRVLYAFGPDSTVRWQFTADNAILASPALDAAGNLYFAVAASGKFYSLTPAGAIRWIYSGATANVNASACLSADGATAYFAGNDRRLHAVATADGTARWTFPLGGPVNFSAPAIDANGVIYVGCDDFKLYAVNAAGTLRRTYDTGGPITSSPALSGTTLYIGSNDAKLYAFDLGVSGGGGAWPQDRQNAHRLGRAPAAAIALALAVAPQPQTAVVGSPLTLTVVADGPGPLTYQWLKDSVALPGATLPTLAVATATAAQAGAYTVTVTGPLGPVTSAPAAVAVEAPVVGRLANLSVRTTAGTGPQTLIVGFALAGSPDKPLLLRAIGPSLASFGLAGVLADPRLQLFSGPTVLAANDNWATSVAGDTPAALAAAFAAAGAFPLDAASRDAALVRPMGPGTYTAQVSGPGAAGLALAELYDTAPAAGARLTNVSARAQVETGGGILIVGFTLSGNVPRTLLLRAIGPTLAAFGVTGALADPQLALYRGTALLQSNDNWGVSGPGSPGPVALAATFAAVGAFPLASPASKDAALLVTVVPGSYTAQVSGLRLTTGVALVEIYEVP